MGNGVSYGIEGEGRGSGASSPDSVNNDENTIEGLQNKFKSEIPEIIYNEEDVSSFLQEIEDGIDNEKIIITNHPTINEAWMEYLCKRINLNNEGQSTQIDVSACSLKYSTLNSLLSGIEERNQIGEFSINLSKITLPQSNKISDPENKAADRIAEFKETIGEEKVSWNNQIPPASVEPNSVETVEEKSISNQMEL